MSNRPVLSVVITTKNEAANIAACVHSFDRVRDRVEIIVVDNRSTDDTKAIAASLGAVVLDKGPERSAQRNLGWRTARADWVVILDADMILPEETVEEILEIAEEGRGLRSTADGLSDSTRRAAASPGDAAARRVTEDQLSIVQPQTFNLQPVVQPPTFNLQHVVQPPTSNLQPVPQAYWIPEVRTGAGFRVKARNFERSFYDGTCVDALRLFHKSVLEATGGYDEHLIAGPEDWDLDLQILATGAKCAVLKHNLIHNEKRLTLKRMLEKKAYYTKSFAAYRAKWPTHPSVRKQFSPWYRFVGVFVERGKWRKILRHPILFAGVLFERFAVGLTYLLKK